MKIYSQKAFTLIELLVVISIMLILGLVVMTSVVEARKESRDTARATTAEQLSLGIRLYKEAEGKYPQYPNGVELGVGNPIDAQLAPFIKEIPKDPLTQGSGDDYEYWYYPNFLCNGERHDVVIVKQMEMGDNGNFDEVCGGGAVLPMQIPFVTTAYAYHCPAVDAEGRTTDGIFVGSNQRYCHGVGSCAVSVSPTVVNLNAAGSIIERLNITWNNHSSERAVDIYGPNGYSLHQWDSTGSGVPLQHPPKGLIAGSYSVGATNCVPAPLQVNPYVPPVAPTQCNDGVDNADSEDTLVDMADPGCTSSTDNSEVNVVDYVDTPGSTPVTPTVTENYTSAAYVVFIN